MWFLPLLFSSQIILSWTLPAPDVFRGQNGVNLDGRKKAHGEGEKCPTERPGYCTCKTRGDGLDITCQDVNSNQLDVSYIPYFKLFSTFDQYVSNRYRVKVCRTVCIKNVRSVCLKFLIPFVATFFIL